ncbi:MAG: metallophosphoesterase [Nannocystaceae bacterium]
MALGLAALGLLPQVAAEAAAATLERGPYLHQTGPSSTIVVWRTDAASTGEVRLGLSPDALDVPVAAVGVGPQHMVKLSGLTPATRYYYAVFGDGELMAGGDALHTFVTAPAVGARSKIRAWVVGDSGTGDAPQLAVRDAALAHVGRYRPQLFLHMGDMAYGDGTDAEFTANFFAPYAEVLRDVTIWPTLGNHEGHSAASATQSGPYYDSYVLPIAGDVGGLPSGTEAYYSFDHGNVHFIVLDSHDSSRAPDGAMLQWLGIDLQSTTQEWIIAFWHHPPYTKGTHDSDVELAHVEMRENALPILEAGGVDLVLGGHSHIYERSYLVTGAYDTPTPAMGILSLSDGRPAGDGPYVKQPGGLGHAGSLYVVAGHGGAATGQSAEHPLMFFSEPENGSCVLDVHENRLTLINIRADGEVTDHVALVKGEGIEIYHPNGGEQLAAGGAAEILWATVGEVPEVRVEYSLDDGVSWKTIVDATPNTGAYTWEVPLVETETGLVRVSSTENAALADESNAGFVTGGGPSLDLIDWGATWSYHDQGVDLGVGWRQPGFDFSGWPSGDAELGYGDGDEATVLEDVDPKRPSAYFLKTVDLPAPITAAELQLRYDDGAAVWVNGQLVGSVNVDGLDYGAWASVQSEDNALYVAPVSLDPNPFVVGKNAVAVMVKQVNETSSDLSFDLKLTVTEVLQEPETTGGETTGGTDVTGTGGSSSGGTGLTGGSATATTGTGIDGEGSGCACRVDGEAPRRAPAVLVALWGLAALRRRR